SFSSRLRFQPRATMRPSKTTTAPTGTSSASSARCAQRRASSIQSSSEEKPSEERPSDEGPSAEDGPGQSSVLSPVAVAGIARAKKRSQEWYPMRVMAITDILRKVFLWDLIQGLGVTFR